MDESTVRSCLRNSIGMWTFVACLVLILIAPPTVSVAQIVTNITPTTHAPLNLGTDVDQVGSTTEITGGTRPGSGTNLFHSFDSFTLGTGDTAHFLNDMHLPTTNIFGRVIGGETSTIDGTLQTNNPLNAADPMNFGAANLWLVNPSGVMLGPNVHLEVGGSVSMSTADYLRFDGTATLFDILSSPASLGPLSVAPVVAFGFLSQDLPAPIDVRGSTLHVLEGKSLSLVGGDITLQAETFEDGTIQAANLRAPGGQINLVSVASPGEVLVPSFQTGPNINESSFTTMGTVTIKEGALLDVSGQLDEFGTPIGNGNSGTVLVRGGQLVMETSSAIVANTVGAMDGAGTAVDIQVSQDVALSNGATIVVGTSGSGRGGDVVIEGMDVHLSDFSEIRTGTSGPSPGGDLFLNVGTLRLLSGSQILSTTAGTDLDFDGVVDVIGGVGGNVMIQGLRGMGSVADSVVVSDGSGIISEAQPFSEGGGHISITAKSLDLQGASSIKSSTTANKTDLHGDGDVDVTGRGGNVVANVQQLSVKDGAAIASSAGSSSEGAADGGTVTVQGYNGPGSKADSVLLSGQNTGIVSDSASFGLPGVLTVNAGTLTITNGAVIAAGSAQSVGPAGEVRVKADSVVISADGQIFSRSFAQNSGQVTITTDALTLDNGFIETSTSSETGGRGGDVVLDVRSGTVSLTNGARINSQSGSQEFPFSTGRAGDITITGASVTLGNHAEITSSSQGTVPDAGDAGNVTVTASGAFTSDASTISTNTSGAGRGGEVVLNVGTVSLSNEAKINSSTSEAGRAGDVTMNVGSLTLANQAEITSSSIGTVAGAGDAGNVTISSSGAFTSDASTIATNTSSDGRGGDVVLKVGSISLSSEAKINSSTSQAGRAGDVTMNVGTLSLANGSIISSASTGTDAITNPDDGTIQAPGTAGNVAITAAGSFTSDGGTVATSAEANRGGDVSITAHSVQLSNGTLITANSNAPLEVKETVLINGQLVEQVVGDGNAGDITVRSGSTLVMQNSSMTTEARFASGGQIEIITPEMMRVIDGRVSTSVAGSATDTAGGNITIDPQFVVLQGGQIVAQAFAGSGGAINIIATSAFIANPTSIVDASSTLGISGTINIQSPVQNIGGELTALSQEFSSAAALLAQQCAAQAAGGTFSTFVVSGREGLPVEPGGYLASPSFTAELLGSRLSGGNSYRPIAAVTGAFSKSDAPPVQLVKFGNACHSVQ